jgi:hypothetical protein
MNMKRYSTLLVSSLIMMAFIYSNCSKSDPPPPPPSNSELLVRSSWKFKSASAQGIGDVSGNIPTCYKDNLNVFVSNGTGSVNESTDICSPVFCGPFYLEFSIKRNTIIYINGIIPRRIADI